MENVEVTTYLRRPKHIFANIVVLQEKIDNLRIKMLPRAISYDKDRVQTSPQDPMPNFAAEIDELDRQMVKLMNDYYESVGEVEKTIREVENEDARLILAKRYVGLKSWDTIENEVNWSRKTIFRRHSLGLEVIKKILDQNKIDTH